MKNNIVAVKYEDAFVHGTFGGKAYSYYTKKNVEVGDLVEAPTKNGTNIAIVSRVNIPEEEIENIRPYMKTITRKINRDRYINFNEILEDVA